MSDRKRRYKRLKRKMRITANEFVRTILESLSDADILTIQKRPYTVVAYTVFLPLAGGGEYVGFSKQNPIDKWNAEEGLKRATHRARLAIVDTVVARNMKALRERGVLADYLDGDIPIKDVPYDDATFYATDDGLEEKKAVPGRLEGRLAELVADFK